MKFLFLIAMIVGVWYAMKPRAKTATMTAAEARELLGLSVDADLAAIRAAHHRLIARVHPDAGGSDALARRVNVARDVLVRALDAPPR